MLGDSLITLNLKKTMRAFIREVYTSGEINYY